MKNEILLMLLLLVRCSNPKKEQCENKPIEKEVVILDKSIVDKCFLYDTKSGFGKRFLRIDGFEEPYYIGKIYSKICDMIDRSRCVVGFISTRHIHATEIIVKDSIAYYQYYEHLSEEIKRDVIAHNVLEEEE